MPRILPRVMTKAVRIHPLLGKLMGVCRTIDSAKRELRWLEDEVLRLDERDSFRLLQRYRIPFQPSPSDFTKSDRRGRWERLLLQRFVDERAKGTPLQLVVENQPFGYLNINVRPGCFIPRWETEEWTLALASRLRQISSIKENFTLVDLCSGSGCIPLLLKDYISADIKESSYEKYGKPNTRATFIGIEKSPTAIHVARLNLKHLQPPTQKHTNQTLYFLHQDILHLPTSAFQGRVDIITCNPPYIPLSVKPTLSRSVTKYEPSEALFVPSTHGDEYYHLLLSTATRWSTPALIMEVGDLAQAERVKSLFDTNDWKTSIWLDSAGQGRVVVAVNEEKWEFLLQQPDYSHNLDLSVFPRQERLARGKPGSILAMFERPRLITPERNVTRPKKGKEDQRQQEERDMNFIDRMLEKLKVKNQSDDNKTGFIKYLEDLKKISK